jgi:hypothetical protein
VRAWLSLPVLIAAALPARPARAVGACEGMAARYHLTAVAVPAGLLAFEVSIPYCAEGDEEATQAILVTDLELGARRWFANPRRGREASAVKALVGKGKLLGTAAWRALGKQRGFQPAGAAAPGEACRADAVALDGQRVVAWGDAEAKDSFVMQRLGVRVGGRDGVVVETGAHPHGADPPALWVVSVPSGPRVYLSTARCMGGPPPGSFGPDDPGMCYTEWSLSFRDLPPTPGCAPGR